MVGNNNKPPVQLLNISISITIFFWSIKSLCNLYHDFSSVYNPISSMQYYRPTMPSQLFENQSDDNEVEGTDDDISPPPPPTFHPNNSYKDDH